MLRYDVSDCWILRAHVEDRKIVGYEAVVPFFLPFINISRNIRKEKKNQDSSLLSKPIRYGKKKACVGDENTLTIAITVYISLLVQQDWKNLPSLQSGQLVVFDQIMR